MSETMPAAELAGVTLVIPAFEPDTRLPEIVSNLSQHPFHLIVVIDDGSGPTYRNVFNQVQTFPAVKLLVHPENRGKGAALKTAFSYIAEHDVDHTRSIITLDSDGQHAAHDILSIANQAQVDGDKFIMGVRSFSNDVPLRSRFGNLLTRRVMCAVSQVDLEDTQTGLRCLPLAFAVATLVIDADRYEFELECILLAKSSDVAIVQHPIQTIYIDENASSHFRPVMDSLRIYFVFVRYATISTSSFLVDIGLFAALHYFGIGIIASTYVARLVSGAFNFHFNKHVAFHSHDKRRILRESLGYVALAILLASISGITVDWLATGPGWNATPAKILVDTLLFLFSFLTQRFIIFRTT